MKLTTKFIVGCLIIITLIWGAIALKSVELPTSGPEGSLMVLSISNAQYNPGDIFYRALAAVKSGGGESFKIAWTADDIKQYIDDPYTIVENGVYGDMIINKNEKRWFTQTAYNAKTIYDFEILPGFTQFLTCNIDKCEDEYPTKNIVWASTGTWVGCRCIAGNNWGTYGYFKDMGKRYWEITASFTGNKMSGVLNSDSEHGLALPIGCSEWDKDCKIKIYSVGALDGLWTTSYPNPAQWFPLIIRQTGRLTDFDPEDVDNINIGEVDHSSFWCKDYKGGNIYGCFSNLKASTFCNEEEAFKECISAWVTQRSQLFGDKTQIWREESLGSLAKNAYWDGDTLVVEETPHTNQKIELFTFDIDAEWLGIQQVYGKPRLECPENTEHLSAGTASWTGSIKNIGSSVGAFSMAVECEGTTSATIFPQGVSGMQPNDKKTISGTVSGEATGGEDKVSECIISAWASAFPERNDLRDECTFYDTTKPRVNVCIPDRNYCSDDTMSVCVCNSAGTELVCPPIAGQECVLGCEASPGGAQCKGCAEEGYSCTITGDTDTCCEGLKCESGKCIKTHPDDPCKRDCKFFDVKCWWNKALRKDCICTASLKRLGMDYVFCKIQNILGPLILVLSLFGLLIGGAVSYDFMNKIFKQKGIAISFAVILGLLVAYLIFAYWYIGIMVLIAYFALKLILDRIIPKPIKRRKKR